MKDVKFICCEACNQLVEKPVCFLLNKVIDDPKLILDNCPLDKIDEKKLIRMQKWLNKDMEEVVDELSVYLNMESDELSGVYESILSIYHYADFISEKFKKDIELELRYQLFVFDSCFEIQETEIIIPERKIIEKELVQTHWLD